MSRTDQRRRRVLRAVAPVAGLLAVGLLVWQGSYAAFSATTSNTGNDWTTGALTLTNNGGVGSAYSVGTTATFGGANLKPGATGTQCLTVKSSGSLAGALKFYQPTLVDAVGGTTTLGTQIQATVTAISLAGAAPDVIADCSNWPVGTTTTLQTNTPLTTMPTTYIGATVSMPVAAGPQRVAYRVNWTFVSTAQDNSLQSKTATAGFAWEIQ